MYVVVLYQPLFTKHAFTKKAKAILYRRDTQAQAVVWAALMIPKLTQGYTQKTKYHKAKKKKNEVQARGALT